MTLTRSPGVTKPPTPWLLSTEIVIAWWPFGTCDENPPTSVATTNEPLTMNWPFEIAPTAILFVRSAAFDTALGGRMFLGTCFVAMSPLFRASDAAVPCKMSLLATEHVDALDILLRPGVRLVGVLIGHVGRDAGQHDSGDRDEHTPVPHGDPLTSAR